MAITFKSSSASNIAKRKMKLEVRFLPEVKSYFKNITLDFNRVYSTTGLIPSQSIYFEDTVAMLRKQYRRVVREFSDDMRSNKKEIKQVSEEDKELETEINSAILALTTADIIERSIKQANIIIDTNTRQLNEAIETANEEFPDATSEEISKEATKNAAESFKPRSDLIAEEETGGMANETMFTEANVLSDNSNLVVIPFIVLSNKRWDADLDKRTRSAHAAADGQVQKLLEPYVVGGELLMYPKDRSLGASSANTIRCRCESRMEISWS